MAEEEQIILPERFKKLDWICSSLQSAGTNYIDTGIKPNQNTGFYVDFEMVNGKTNPIESAVLGSRDASNNKDFQFSIWNGGIIRFGDVYELSVPFGLRTRHIVCLKNREVYFDDIHKHSLRSNEWQGGFNVYLFSLNDSNSSVQGSETKIYRAKFYDGDTLLKDFVPAYDTYNCNFCMYDLVNEKAHYMSGSGPYTSSMEEKEDEQLGIFHKLPEGFKHVKYLIAKGQQFIDTNYIPTNETGYYLEGQGYTTSETYYFGLRENTSTNSRIYACATPNVNWGWMTYGTLTNAAANLRQETKFYHNFLNSRVSKATINETDFTYNLPELNFTPTLNVHLFTFNNAGVPHATYGLKGRIDTFLISEGDQIVRQFVPCLDEDGIPCMYELYTGTVHYNQGSGQFSYPREYTNEPINLPAGYTKCVYLQSDGTQWIDTEVIPNDDTGVYLKAQHLSYGDFTPFGSWENSSAYYYPPRFNTSSKAGIYSFGTTYQNAFYYDKGDDLVFTSTMNLYNDRTVNFWSEDTNWFGIIPVNFTTTFTRPLWLFSYNMNNTTIDATYGKFGGRIFRAKITQGDTLIRDFVPCLDMDNRPCMYDLVTQEPYYNQSGGVEFAYCVEHQLPSDFSKLKYLESNGTQFIKTGYIPTNNTGLYIDAYNTVVRTDWTQPFALRETNGNTYVSVGRVNKATNGAGFGWNAYTSPGGTGDCRYEATLNWLNDKKSIISAPAFAQRVNTLANLAFTPTIDLCLFGIHYYDGTYNSVYYRIYRAKISEGTEIVRDFVPAWDDNKQKPCMYDLINNVAYYNDGEGEFIYNRDFEGTYKGFGVLGGIGNKLGSDYIFGDFIEVDFIEHDTPNKYMIDLLTREEPYDTASIGFYVECAYVDTTLKSGPISIWGFNGTKGTWFIKPLEKTRDYDDSVSGNYYIKNAYLGIIPVGTKLRGEMNFLMNKVHWVKGGDYHYKLSLENYEIESLTSGIYAYGILNPYCKLYKLKISQGKHITRDFIPVINNQGVPTLYDKIKNELFTPDVKNAIAGLNSITKALRLKLPENGGSIKLSIPQEQTSSSHEEKIRANNPNWEITFYYH